MNKTANVSDLGLDIKTHLCNHCTHRDAACFNLQYAYGSGRGSVEGLSNICACNGFEAKLIGRRRHDAKDPKLEQDPRIPLGDSSSS